MVLSSVLRIGILTILNLKCEWLLVDSLAETAFKISGISIPVSSSAETHLQRIGTQIVTREVRKQGLGKKFQATHFICNIRSPRVFSWANEFVPALAPAPAGPTVLRTFFSKWLDRLQSLPSDSSMMNQMEVQKVAVLLGILIVIRQLNRSII